MIEAGAHLFREGGATAVTLEAVIQHAGTSTGSFYSRFGDMSGFLDTMHAQMIANLGDSIEKVFVTAGKKTDLEASITAVCAGLFEVINQHKDQAYFFITANNPKWKNAGKNLALYLTDETASTIKAHLPNPSNTHLKLKIELAVRHITSMTYQQIMFDQTHYSRTNITPKKLAKEMAHELSTYLLATNT